MLWVYLLTITKLTCFTSSDINECLEKVCHVDATCVNTNGSFNCFCNDGFTGDGVISCQCQVSDPCQSAQCQNGGLCIAISGSCTDYNCTCTECYTGQFCETLMDPCGNNPCQNGGNCFAIPGSCIDYECICTGCYTGQFCETLLNACDNNPCQNGGNCVAIPGSCIVYECICTGCYTGQLCETSC
ncbi:uncharacterized protein LOC102805706 isoform X2 [Saccoglossus kowalevskii]